MEQKEFEEVYTYKNLFYIEPPHNLMITAMKPLILDHMTGSTCASIEVLHLETLSLLGTRTKWKHAHIVPVPRRNRYHNHLFQINILTKCPLLEKEE